MKHIPKQEWMGCAIASAAMLGDLSYQEAAERSHYRDPAWTRGPQQMHTLLEAVTGTEWRLWPDGIRDLRVIYFSSPPWPVVVWIQDAATNPHAAQWIVLDDQTVHDPGERSAWTRESYPLRNWFVGRVAEPVRPQELFQGRTRTKRAYRPLKRRAMGVKMRVVQGEPRGSYLDFPDGEFVVGRGRECHVRPNAELVSRRHCMLVINGHAVRVGDLGSTHGTFVNGRRINGETPLNNGDTLQLGPLVLEVVKPDDHHDDGPAGTAQIRPDGSPSPCLEVSADWRPSYYTYESETEIRKRVPAAISDSDSDWRL